MIREMEESWIDVHDPHRVTTTSFSYEADSEDCEDDEGYDSEDAGALELHTTRADIDLDMSLDTLINPGPLGSPGSSKKPSGSPPGASVRGVRHVGSAGRVVPGSVRVVSEDQLRNKTRSVVYSSGSSSDTSVKRRRRVRQSNDSSLGTVTLAAAGISLVAVSFSAGYAFGRRSVRVVG